MSASSSTASSALTRTRAAILIVASVAAAYSVYYLHSSIYDDSEHTTPSPPLHRSNAIHRRRRRTLTANEVEPVSAETAAENDEDAHIVARPLTDGATVVDDQEYQDDYSWTDVPPTYQRTGQNIVQLLFRVSEDATRRNAYVHRGCGCNSCGVVPIRGIRYRCSNCADFDLCENCEAQGLHTKTHIFYKVKIPAPSFGPKNIQPVWYTGDPDGIQRMLPKEMITKLSNETGFERPELDAYWEQWTFMANTEWREDPDEVCLAMDRKTFERCLVPSTTGSRHAAPSLIYDRMFAFYDTNNDNLISFAEFLHGLAFRKKRDKWRKIFEGYDIDGDGYVDRKDFLRMFRAYYVLYRQMHRDMLEGYDDQVMSSTDAQQLVTGRQPLSSAFGRDGRFPPAPNAHTGVGKAAQPNGELEIIDGKGVINESSNDTGNREDVFTRRSFGGDESERMLELGRQRRNAFRVRAVAQENHAAVLLNPPETPDQLTRTILNGIAQNSGFETMDDLLDNSQFRVSGHQDDDSEWEDGDDSKVRADDDNDDRWPPSFITDELVEEVLGPGFTLQAEVLKSREIRQAVLAHYVRKQKARREIHERWVRRQFYTDEEEGATPPEGWEDSDDILVRNGMAGGGESSKSQPQSRPLSPRSRSSSKVRFVEDDDYDIRSTTSSTSRSIPERWGGMEIADAEKDAGKEILYQVTQQAFNELLDPIFKSQEDLAESIALTKPERDQYRHLYSTSEFEAWASEKDAKRKPKNRDAKSEFISKITKQVPSSESQMWPGFPGFPENDMEEEIRQRPLDDLLAETGYTIAEEPNEDSDTIPEPEELPESSTSQQQLVQRTEEIINSPLDNDDESAAANVDEIIETLISQEENPGNVSESTIKVTEITPKEDQYRDPTMPQFRPNSHSTSESPKISPTSTDTPKATEAQSSDLPEWDVPDKDTLWMYWKLDRVAKEAESRGGWGKLNFDEWERKIKACIRAGKGNSMDYLGSWIEFCIP